MGLSQATAPVRPDEEEGKEIAFQESLVTPRERGWLLQPPADTQAVLQALLKDAIESSTADPACR